MRREQVFWGWGRPGAGHGLPPHAAKVLAASLGVSGEIVSRPVALADVRLRPSALDPGARARLERIVGAAHVRDDREARVLRCRGKSYLDLLAQRAGDCESAPDAVVAPDGHAQAEAVLRACADAGVAVIPFGGGTSVVGGVEPERAGLEAAISLDLRRMDRVLAVDDRSLLARLQPGLRLRETDEALAAHGLTLGHFPQSYEWATVGGCVATRSAGQASTGFGRVDDNVEAARCATPAGELASLDAPATAAGPRLRELVVGSEGMLGVITEVTLRVRPCAAAERYEGWMFHSFAEGADALRVLAQAGLAPDVARLSDEPETRQSLGVVSARGADAFLRVRGVREGCLAIVGFAGTPEDVARRRTVAARHLRKAGGVALGRGVGEKWRASRFAGPYVRDDLLDRGVLVETLETAATWSKLDALKGAVETALAAALPGAHVGCHISHLYASGASLYFTVFAAQGPDPAARWRAAKAAACDAIVAQGATITHHHAIGRDHAPWLGAEAGPLGLELLRAVKERCDPAGIMNPGKVLSLEAARRG